MTWKQSQLGRVIRQALTKRTFRTTREGGLMVVRRVLCYLVLLHFQAWSCLVQAARVSPNSGRQFQALPLCLTPAPDEACLDQPRAPPGHGEGVSSWHFSCRSESSNK